MTKFRNGARASRPPGGQDGRAPFQVQKKLPLPVARFHIPRTVFVIAKYQQLLQQLGLATLEQVKAFQGQLIKNHKGRRDILKISVTGNASRPLVLFLKRNWKPYKKDGLASFFSHGEAWSQSRVEWENSRALLRAGLRAAEPVAFGEDCGLLWEKFSFLITAAAEGDQTVGEFLQSCRDRAQRRRVFDLLAREIRKLHDDPLELDELILHVAKADATDDARLRESLKAHFARETELHPNRIELHSIDELRRLQGYGTQLKEQRVVDHRPAVTEQILNPKS